VKHIPYWSALGFLEGQVPVVVYRHGAKYFVSSNLERSRQELRDRYKIRTLIEEVIRVLKQECVRGRKFASTAHWAIDRIFDLEWQGCQLRSVTAYRRHLQAGLLAFLYLDCLKTKYRASHHKLRKRCISRKILVTPQDIAGFFATA
jgi:hypothetical protein